MRLVRLVRHLHQRVRELSAANAANVTVVFALATVPIAGFVGAAVDYSSANSIKAAMQAATDSTALMLSKDAATATSGSLNTKASNYFMALFNRPQATITSVTPTYTTTDGSQVVVTAKGSVKTNFMGLLGFSQLNIATTSTIKWGNTRLRVALVLDNTGSMAEDGKMQALITASKNLLTQLQSAATNNGDVYVSIVPFSKDVNVDPSNYKAKWIDWSDCDNNNGSCKNYKNYYKSGSPGDKDTCQNYNGAWTKAKRNTWNGCVADRGNSSGPNSANYDANATAPTTSITATLYPAEQYSYCTDAAAMPLNYDWSSMKSLIGSMSPNGSTNQTIGLQLGWQSLVGGGPFPAPPPMDSNYQYSQVIILLTDGLNTQNRWNGNGSDQSLQVDARMAIACSNVKAAGMTLYTIQVNTGGDQTSSLLRTCASDTSKFFLLTSSNQMVTTFESIGTALSNLRIAK
jgi:Flp pilus assembly protein TadG